MVEYYEIIKSDLSFQKIELKMLKINCNYIYKISCSYFTCLFQKFVIWIFGLFYPILISKCEIHIYRKEKKLMPLKWISFWILEEKNVVSNVYFNMVICLSIDKSFKK